MVPPVRSEVLPVTPVPLSIMHNRAHLDRCADERTASHKSMEKERKKGGRTENWPGIYTPGGAGSERGGGKRVRQETNGVAGRVAEISLFALMSDGPSPEIIEFFRKHPALA
jgi:hypothetical protein